MFYTPYSEIIPTKGSCDACEKKKCNQIFLPVCTTGELYERFVRKRAHVKYQSQSEVFTSH